MPCTADMLRELKSLFRRLTRSVFVCSDHRGPNPPFGYAALSEVERVGPQI